MKKNQSGLIKLESQRLNILLAWPSFVFLLMLCPAKASGLPDLIKNSQANQYAVAALSYSSVAKACGEEKLSDQLKIRLVKLLRIANKKKSLTSNGYDTLRDPNHFVSVGVGVFQSNPYIGCAEGREYARLVIPRLDAVLKLN